MFAEYDEQHAQPPEPKCHGGCLPGSCWCLERQEQEAHENGDERASLLPGEARLEPAGEGHKRMAAWWGHAGRA